MKRGKRRVEGLKKSIIYENTMHLRSDFAIEAQDNKRLTLLSCFGIAEYGPHRISLRVRRGHVIIEGRELICDSYVNGGVVVDGYIESVVFSLSGDEK